MTCTVTPTSCDNVNVSGVAMLDGRFIVNMTGTFTPGTRFTLLYAAGGLGTTRFSSQSIQYPTGQGFTPKITYDANNVYLCLVPTAGTGCN